MATKPIRIYGVLSRITLAKDQTSTSDMTQETGKSRRKKPTSVHAIKKAK